MSDKIKKGAFILRRHNHTVNTAVAQHHPKRVDVGGGMLVRGYMVGNDCIPYDLSLGSAIQRSSKNNQWVSVKRPKDQSVPSA